MSILSLFLAEGTRQSMGIVSMLGGNLPLDPSHFLRNIVFMHHFSPPSSSSGVQMTGACAAAKSLMVVVSR